MIGITHGDKNSASNCHYIQAEYGLEGLQGTYFDDSGICKIVLCISLSAT